MGPPDVGPPDVGRPDVGRPDVGRPDVGPPDVGPPEAQPDAQPDAQPEAPSQQTTPPADAVPATGRAGPGRYGLLLAILVLNYLLSAFVSGRWVQVLQVALFIVTALLAARSSREAPRIMRIGALSLIAGTLIVIVVWLLATPEVGQGVISIWTGLVLLLTVVLIVTRVLSFDTVTIQSIFGAVSAYLILGLMFAAFYAAIDHLGGGHFFASSQPDNTKTFQYFSFTTLTTLGYGDFTAGENGGRAVAVLEALTGQIFLATLVARLVAAFRPRR